MKNSLPVKPLTRLAFIVFLVMGSLTLKDNNLVVTPYSKMGIINLELNLSPAKRDAMLSAWRHGFNTVRVYKDTTSFLQTTNGIQAVICQNNADYLFIASYVCLLLLLLYRLDKKNFLLLGAIAVIAGLMDVLEDLGINHTLNSYPHQPLPSPWTIGTFGWLKVIMLAVLLAIIVIKSRKQHWLKVLSDDLSKIVSLVWRFRVSAIILLLLFLCLYFSDQGQDLLLTINSAQFACLCFLLTVTVLALLCWHIPKALDNAKTLAFSQFWLGPVDFGPRTPAKVDIARLLGCAGFLVPATGILQTMDAYHLQYWLSPVPPALILIAIILLYAIALRHNWIGSFFTDANGIRLKRYFAVILLLVLPVIIFGIQPNNREPYYLAYLSLDLVLLSAVFLITATLRTCIPATTKLKFIKNWAIAPWITFGALLLSLFFIACNFPCFLHLLTDRSRYYTMPIVFCAVAAYLLFFSWLLFAGKKQAYNLLPSCCSLLFLSPRTPAALTITQKSSLIPRKWIPWSVTHPGG